MQCRNSGMFKPYLRCINVVATVHQITSRGSVLHHQCVFIHICHKEEERTFSMDLAVCTQQAPKWQWHDSNFSSGPHGCSILLEAFFLGMLFRRASHAFLDSWWFSCSYFCPFTGSSFNEDKPSLVLGFFPSLTKIVLYCFCHWFAKLATE